MANLLVVDDSDPVRECVVDLLNQQVKHCIFQAADGQEAQIRILEANPPIDLVITDYSMPKMNGNELATWIQKEHPEIPVILMSSDPHSRSLASERFLRKPEDLLLLPKVIEELLRKRIPA